MKSYLYMETLETYNQHTAFSSFLKLIILYKIVFFKNASYYESYPHTNDFYQSFF